MFDDTPVESHSSTHESPSYLAASFPPPAHDTTAKRLHHLEFLVSTLRSDATDQLETKMRLGKLEEICESQKSEIEFLKAANEREVIEDETDMTFYDNIFSLGE
jgi:hypothetical protein